ncbi:MAG TPA: hypothetical protein DGT21_12105 [Armatimonadetes bacterium]|nr:hypothetical protein [Armatimonadota bacterium]
MMSRIVVAMLVVIVMQMPSAAAVGVPWAEVRDSVRPHPVSLSTVLVKAGGPVAVIGVPAHPAYAGIARELQSSIYERYGTEVPLLPGASLVSGRAFRFSEEVLRPPGEGAHNLILLGDLTSNPAIARLYIDYYAFEDAAYPGAGGHTVRTIVDPTGLGWNAVILGGPRPEDVRAACSEYAALIEGREGEAWSPYCLSVTPGIGVGMDQIMHRAGTSRPWPEAWAGDLLPPGSDEYRASHPEKSPEQYVLDILNRHLTYFGLHFGTTGEREFAEAVGKAMDAVYVNLDWVEQRRQGNYDEHYMVEIWLRAWQQVANSGYLTDEQRSRGYSVMGFLAGQMQMYRPNLDEYGTTSYRILSRHQYSGVLAGDALCRYIQRHCEAGPALAATISGNREAFGTVIRTMLSTYTTGFDHKWGLDGNWHLMQAALEEPYPEYITTETLRLNADYATMCMNNAGVFVNFGAENIGAREGYDAYQILGRAETVLHDGGYRWMLDRGMKTYPYKSFIMSLNWLAHWYQPGLEPSEPTRLVGLNRLRVSTPIHEDLVAGRGRLYAGIPVVNDVPLDDTFTKITFRDGLGEDDQYLLYDGLGGITYSGNDANAICEYSRYGQPLLVQYTVQHDPFYQNTVSVSRGNAGDATGTFARLLAMADIGPMCYVASEVDPQCGSRHVRHLFMEKGRYFVVVDDLTLADTDEASLACTFRGLGEGEIGPDGHTWRVRAANADLALQSVPVSGQSPVPQLSLSVEEAGANTGGEGVRISVLRETAARQFARGDTYRYANLFYGLPTGADPGYEAVSVSADMMLVRSNSGEPIALYGVGADGPAAARSIECRAGAFRLSPDGAQFIALRELLLPGEPALSLAHPVTVAMDFRERTVTVQAPTVRCTGTVVWEPEWSVTATDGELAEGVTLPDGQRLRLDVAGLSDAIRDAVRAYADTPIPTPASEPRPALPLSIRAAQLLPPDSRVNAVVHADIAGDGQEEVLCGLENGRLVLIHPGGEAPLEVQTGSAPLRSVWAGRLEGVPTLICGAQDGEVRAYDLAGRLLWQYHNRRWQHTPKLAVYSIAVADFRLDGSQPVALGCHGGVLLLDVRGEPAELQWTPVYAHMVMPTSVVGLSGEARPWLVANSAGGGLKLVDPVAGTVINGWLQGWGGPASYQAVHEFGGPDQWFVHAGAVGVGCARLVDDAWRDGSRAASAIWADGWYKRTDGETRAVAVHDFDGDGIREILTGNETGFLVCYAHTGERLWKRLVGTPVNALLIADVTGDGRPELIVGGDDPGLTVYDAEWKVLAQWSPDAPDGIVNIWQDANGVVAVTRSGGVVRLMFE